MTECYPISSNPLPPGRRRRGSVGVAAGTDLAVMNEAGDLLPSGVVGEIVVRGPHVTGGYLNQPDAVGGFAHEWFRTGDQGYVDADGYLFFTNRIKEMINRGGEKISPLEVDRVLVDHPEVAEAVALPLPHLTLGEDVAAAVVLRENASVTERDLQAFTEARLAAFKVPRRIVFVNELPRSAGGKVRRKILTETLDLEARGAAAAPHGAARSDSQAQEKLVRMWAQLLGIAVTMIGIHDNFFDLGGNSLLAIQLIGQVDRMFGMHLPLAAFLQAPTIEHLTQVVSREASSKAWSALVPIQPRGSKPPFFWVHGDSSNGFLTTYLAGDQPLCGLDHQGQDGKPARHTTVEAIASHYFDEVRRVQATGPYFFGGFSFGGTVAFEMAQQLKKTGERVDLLVMLDSHFPGADVADAAVQETRPVGTEVHRHLRNVRALPLWERVAYVMVRLQSRVSQHLAKATTLFKRSYCWMLLRTGQRIPAWLLSPYLLGIYQKARRAFSPGAYSGRVVYVKSAQRSSYHQMSWARIVGDGFEWREVPSDHIGVIAPPAAILGAQKLQSWLDAAQQRLAP
jgi:thioesterase domain-containing protein